MLRWLVSVGFLAAAIVACGGASDQALFGGGGSSGSSGSSGNGSSGGTSGGVGPDGGTSSGGPDATIADAGPEFPDANQVLDAACGTRVNAARQPTYLYIVLDGSGSMSTDSKWTSVVPALDQVFDDFQAQGDTTLGVGMMVFSDSLDPTQGVGPYPTNVDVGVAFVNKTQHDALRARIDTASPQAATPTLAALQGAYTVAEKYVPVPPLPTNGRRVVVLMTDGVPTDNSQTQCQQAAAVEFAKGVTTFVVGIGPFPSTDTQSYDPVFLGGLAQAGGAAPSGCNPSEVANQANLCFTQITPGGNPAQLKQAFIDALNKIRQSAASCELGIDGTVDPNKFNVVLTSGSGQEQIVPEGGANGWTYDTSPPTKVILHGASCEALKIDHKATVSFIKGCTTVKG